MQDREISFSLPHFAYSPQDINFKNKFYLSQILWNHLLGA